MNRHLATVIVAPMTTKGGQYPSRVPCRFEDKDGQIALDQLRSVDRIRLVRRLGVLSDDTQAAVLQRLREMFAE
jgi:mRNA interferase MazF